MRRWARVAVADPSTASGLGMHTLRWEYVKDGSGSVGQDCGWVDYVQWQPETLSYVYACPEPAEWDPGRRPSSSNNQSSIILYQFPRLYGRSVDEPICMIEAAGDYAGTYYYHFDALGSVVALTDADADDVQKYDYSVWGQVGADDVDHPNPYLFTGRRFDTETGLYYYRARYYHPEIGRFLQTDPIGYGDGMDLYQYCRNNPANFVDPAGLSPDSISIAFYDGAEPEAFKNAADDMDYYFDMSECPFGMLVTAWIEMKLLDLKDQLGPEWDNVAGIYFFDHSGGPANDPLCTALQFGRESFSLVDADDHRMEDFSKMLDRTLPPDAKVHMRHCDLGETDNWGSLSKIAVWTNRSVTAAVGHVWYEKEEYWPTMADGSRHNFPDYTCAHGYVIAVPLISPYFPPHETILRFRYEDHHGVPYRVY